MLLEELFESKLSVLYHATKFESCRNIIKHDYFRPSRGTIGLSGLSTTADPNYFWGSKEVRFTLDKEKLAKDYKLKKVQEPIHDDSGKIVDESEIKVIADSAIINAHKYIIAIECFKSPPKELEEELKAYCKNFSIKLSANVN